MGEHRQLVDKRMSAMMNRRVLVPLAMNLGARYLREQPYMGSYDEEENTLHWGLGHKEHGDARHRTRASYVGIHYTDGKRHEGPTQQIVTNRRLAWSRKHDNRLAQNDETFGTKEMSYDETYNEIRTFSSMDLIQRFSATAQGEILGIGGSVSSSTEAHGHTELETKQFSKTKKERVIDTTARLLYPGPLYRDDYEWVTDSAGREYQRVSGRTLVEEGPVWLIKCLVETVHTIKPIVQEEFGDALLRINIEDWAGNYGVMPDGEHDNVLEFANISELIAFMEGDLVLRYGWLPKLKLNREGMKALAWLKNENNRRVGPVEWNEVEVSDTWPRLSRALSLRRFGHERSQAIALHRADTACCLVCRRPVDDGEAR